MSSWGGVLYCFESFSCGVEVGGSFDFVLAVKTCCCSRSFEEVDNLDLDVSRVDVNVTSTKKFCEIFNEIFC